MSKDVYKNGDLTATLMCGPTRSDGGDRRMVQLTTSAAYVQVYLDDLGRIGEAVAAEVERNFNALPLGLYRLFWKDGGESIAAVGMLHDGRRWFAPTNWTSSIPEGIASLDWDKVERAELIEGRR